jgi:endonuclease/exonuclease/phosphatase family metal-dependent hydrolase
MLARRTVVVVALLAGGCALPPTRRPASDVATDRPVWLDGNGPIRLRVVTYNLKGLDWTNADLPVFPEASQVADIMTTLHAHSPDLVGLQESRRKADGAAQSEEIAAALGGFDEYSVSTTTLPLPYLQQNAIASRWLMHDRADLDLGPDGLEHRRFLYARVKLPGGRSLHLGNVHDFTTAALQLPAMKAIESFLQGRVKEGDYFVLVGDFNFGPSTAADSCYVYLTQRFAPRLHDPAVALGLAATDPALYTINPGKPTKRIDFVLFSGPLVARAYQTITAPIPNLTYPDHLPALADLEIPGR